MSSTRLASAVFTFFLSSFITSAAWAQGALENPAQNGNESGIGLISGWHCDAGIIQISFDGGPLQDAAYGTERGDTAPACGDSDNGFGLLFNYNLLGDGVHTARAYADGMEFASSTFNVTTLGYEYVQGLAGNHVLRDFPIPGLGVIVSWQESKQNFVIEDFGALDPGSVDPTGYWTFSGNQPAYSAIQVDDFGHVSLIEIDFNRAEPRIYEGDLDGNTVRLQSIYAGAGLASVVVELEFNAPDSAISTLVQCIPNPGYVCTTPVGVPRQMIKCPTVGASCL